MSNKMQNSKGHSKNVLHSTRSKYEEPSLGLAKTRDLSRDRLINRKREATVIKEQKIPLSSRPPALNRQNTTIKGTASKSTSNILSSSKSNIRLSQPLTPTSSRETVKKKPEMKSKAIDSLSSRVTTSKYFPKKYADKEKEIKALKARELLETQTNSNNLIRKDRSRKMDDGDKKMLTPRSRSRTLSPSEIKIVKGPIVNSSSSETSLAKRSIISTHEFKKPSNNYKEVIKEKSKTLSSEETVTDNYDYEDDFDSYESDFEQCSSSDTSEPTTSSSKSSCENSKTADESQESFVTQKRVSSGGTEEERKLDSGNYDLRDPKRIPSVLHGIKEAIERENSNLEQKLIANQDGMFSDEGFEEESKSSMFINFAAARKKEQKQKTLEQTKKRGQEILSMITLDSMYVPLLELFPVPYEIFMLSYGRGGTVQNYCQTNDDNLDEEVQTEEIDTKNKWTQFPVDLITNFHNNEDLVRLTKTSLGVGDDEESSINYVNEWRNLSKCNSNQLEIFLQKKEKIIKQILKEKSIKNISWIKPEERDWPFSAEYTILGINEISFLTMRSVKCIEYSEKSKTQILTVHEKRNINFIADEEGIALRPIICIWNLQEPNIPQHVLLGSDEITTCCFENNFNSLIIAGMENGSVCAWDLSEPTINHMSILDEEKQRWILRSPTYITQADCKKENTKLVAIKNLKRGDDSGKFLAALHVSPSQVCSLSESGTIVIWSILRVNSKHTSSDQSLAHWGKVRLVASITVSLKDVLPELNFDLECYDLQLDSVLPNHLLISTNSGFIIHCLADGSKVIPKCYTSNNENDSPTVCISTFPYGYSYFLVGCKDSSIRLHSLKHEKALTTLYGTEDSDFDYNGLKILQWSQTKPCHIYAVDCGNNLHIWDLEFSDLYPVYSIPLNNNIVALKLLPFSKKKHNYMILAFEDGRVEIHKLQPEFDFTTKIALSQELKHFIHYINVL